MAQTSEVELGIEVTEVFYDATEAINEIPETSQKVQISEKTPFVDETEEKTKDLYLEMEKLYVEGANGFINLIEDKGTRNLIRLFVKLKQFSKLRYLIEHESEECKGEFLKWFQEKPQYKSEMAQNIPEFKEKPKSLNFNRVLDVISTSQREVLLSILVSKNQWASCDEILKTESEEARTRFADWKKKIPCSLSQSEPQNEEPKFRDEDPDLEGYEEIPPSCLKNAKDEMTIAIVGETGVGKSTFINALANYLNSTNIKEARKRFQVLIRGQFTQTDENGKSETIMSEPNVDIEKKLIDNDKFIKTNSQSATQKPLCYELIYGPEGNKKTIRLIDTPGIGDTRSNQEKKNTKEIIKCLAQFEEIDAILILMKPNEGILSTSFKYCLGQLLNLFPTSARKNFLFGFTRARSTFFSHGDTYNILNDYLKTLKSKNKVNISLSESNMFYFDSEPFRYLCATQNGGKYTYCTVEDINTSWKKSVKETFRLLGVVSKLPRHRVRETLMRYYIESVLMALAKPVLQKTRRLLHQREELIQAISHREAFLQNNMVNRKFFEEVETYREDFKDNRFATICNADRCAKTAIINTNGNDQTVVADRRKCHNPCNDTVVKNCVIFHRELRRCEKCGCPPESHIHSNYQIRFHKKTIENPNFQRENETREETKRRLDEDIADFKANFGILNEEKTLLEEYSSDFALFTKKHGMQYNASFISYLDDQIEEAKIAGDKKLVVDLTLYKESYEEKIKMIENVGAVKDRPVKTEQEIDKMIEDLCTRFPDIFEEIEHDETIKEPETALLPKVQIKPEENGWFTSFILG